MKKNTKRTLLFSVLALILCSAMLIGTTFAWFTDSASTAVNKIQAGTLDIGLEMKQGNNWVNAEGQTLAWQKAAGHASEEVLWEPGCTYELPVLKITNKGNLGLQFKVLINSISGDKKLLDAIDFTVDYFSEDPDCKVSLPVDINESTSIPVELPNPMASDPYYEQYIRELGWTGITLYTAAYIQQNGFGTDHMCVKLSAHMKESAGNEYQGKKLENLAVTVVATQMAGEEYDSFNNTYDKDATFDNIVLVKNAAELSAALNATYNTDTTIKLFDNITLSGEWGVHVLNMGSSVKVTIDGNGKTIYGLQSSTTTNIGGFEGNGLITRVYSTHHSTETVATLTVKNLTVDGATLTATSGSNLGTSGVIAANVDFAHFVAEDCSIIDAHVSSSHYAAGFIGYVQQFNYGETVTLKNCTVSGSTFNGNDATGALVALSNAPVTINKATVTSNAINGGAGYSAAALVGTSVKGTTATNVDASGNTFAISNNNYLVNDATYGYIYHHHQPYSVNGTNLSGT